MNPNLIILLEGLLFILVFGGLLWVRREGLAGQFALEGLAVTAVCVAGGLLSGFAIQPTLFLILIYLITMRARLLVGLGNVFLARRRHDLAISLYCLAMRLRPDPLGRASALINCGVAQLRRGKLEEAISSLEAVLDAVQGGRPGPRYEAACRYNLGLACRKAGRETDAVRQFNEAIEAWPGSIYALHAQAALEEKAEASGEQ